MEQIFVRQRFRVELPPGPAELEVTLRPGTSDLAACEQVFGLRAYDLRHSRRFEELAALYRDLVAGGRTPLILDLGANIGAASLWFASAWPACHVVAVDPAVDNFQLLFENLQALENATAMLAGVASAPGRLRVADQGAEKWAYRTERADPGAPGAVPAVTVPALLEEFPGAKGFEPFIVKVDIEGAEAELFSAATDWIDRFPILIIELHDWLFCGQGGSGPFLRAIAQRDRDFVLVGENVFSIANRAPAPLRGARA